MISKQTNIVAINNLLKDDVFFGFSINKKGKIVLNLHECDNIILQTSYHYKLLQIRFCNI